MEEQQKTSSDRTRKGHDEGQEAPGTVRDAEEREWVGELQRKDWVREY